MSVSNPLLNKTELRARMRSIRAEAAAASPGAAEQASRHLPLDHLPAFGVASGYHALGSELSPLPLLRRLASRGVTLALPVAHNRHSPLSFHRWREGDPMVKDAFGIPSPPPSAEVVRPDLVIAPLLAFDRRGGRLGQGAGHYDRTLSDLRRHAKVFVLGLAYAAQELPEAPLEPHDEPLDAVLTEVEFIAVAA